MMPRGDKSSYSVKQKRQEKHIEEGYEKKGVSKKTAKTRAWATVNKATGGEKKAVSRVKKTPNAKKTTTARKATPVKRSVPKKTASKRKAVKKR